MLRESLAFILGSRTEQSLRNSPHIQVWVSTGDNSRVGIEGVKARMMADLRYLERIKQGFGVVQVVLLSPRFVRDAFSGILRVRILSGEGREGAFFLRAIKSHGTNNDFEDL